MERKRAPRQFIGTTQSTCRLCGKGFEYPARSGPPRRRCDQCIRQYNAQRQKRWREANPDRARAHWNRHNDKRKNDPNFRQYKRDNELRRAYGITREQLDEMLEAQQHRCAICGGERTGPGTRLHIDHCHETGRIRGLLCSKCNTLIGLAGDNPDRLMAAAVYLERGK